MVIAFTFVPFLISSNNLFCGIALCLTQLHINSFLQMHLPQVTSEHSTVILITAKMALH